MDGYSVKEAATVLGVPKRRVWELIARGVLSGAPEGDGGMRVFLQPRPGRGSPLSAAPEEPRRTNGNGGHSEAAGEGSPFREILTEFRSLTERYGQALLALGEARGEVAALRSRVELLEARLDLRLPGPRSSSAVAWEMPEYTPPAPPAPEVPTAAEAPDAWEAAAVPDAPDAPDAPEVVEAPSREEPAAEAEVDADADASQVPPIDELQAPAPAADEVRPERDSPRRRRLLRSHSAIAGIAEALERAQDPTLADLPGAREAAEALAALQREVEARDDTLESEAIVDEAAVPPEPEAAAAPAPEPPQPAAEASFVEPAAATSAQELVGEEPSVDAQPEPDAAPTAASAPSPYTTEVVEPDWFADGDFTWLEAAQAESASNEETEETASEETASAEPGPQAAAIQPAALESEEREEMDQEADQALAAEAIQDAFEPAEPGALEPEPEIAVAGEASGPEPEPVIEAIHEPVLEQEPEIEPPEAERVPAADAIQEAFEETFVTDLQAPEADLATEPAVPEPDHSAEADAKPGPDPEASAAVEDGELELEPELEAAFEAEITADEPRPALDREDAGPAADAIQDAFEPPEASPSAEGTPAAIATSREEPFAPADIAVFAVDDSEPEQAAMPDTDAQARPPEARAEPISHEHPPAPPRTEGLGGLAVQAAALPAVQPVTPATSRPQEEELMWLGDEFEAAGFEIAAPGWHSQPEPAAEASVEPPVVPATEALVEQRAEPPVEPSHLAHQEMTHDATAHGMSDADLQQIALDEGWDADEVDAIRTLLGRPTTAEAVDEPDERAATQSSAAFSVDSPLPPDDVHPMDEASAAPPEPEWLPSEEARYEPPDLPFEAEPESMPSVEWPMAEPAGPQPPTVEAAAPEQTAEPTAPEPQVADASAAEPARVLPIEESIRQSIAPRPSEPRPTAPDQDWLRRRRGPAARAYRRLRRLLPG